MKKLRDGIVISIKDVKEERIILKHFSENQGDLKWINGGESVSCWYPSAFAKGFPYTIGVVEGRLCLTIIGNRKVYSVAEFTKQKTQTFCEWVLSGNKKPLK